MSRAPAAARPRLNRERVLDAAVALADREGVEALTVRRLADDLGVHPTSLYNHLPDKAAILDGVVERLFAEAALPDDVADWREWVRRTADTFRRLARAHPGAFMVLTKRPAENVPAFRFTELGLVAFVRGGFPLVDAVRAVRGVSLAILGLALNECPPMGEWVEPVGVDPSEVAAFPRLTEAAGLVDEDDDRHWDAVVEALVAGLERYATRA